MAHIYLSGEEAYITWNEGNHVYAGVILGDAILTEYIDCSQDSKAQGKAYAAKEGIWAVYYGYQYYQYTEGSQSSDSDAHQKSLEARDMAIAHTINAAMAAHPLTFKIAIATEAGTGFLATVGIIPEEKSFGELAVIDAYLILNLAGITDRNPVVEKEKYKADAVAMEWLIDKLEECGNQCVYTGQ